MNEERIKVLFSDEAFVKELMALETPEEVQALLAENEIDLSVEEIKQLNEFLSEHAGEELTEEDLENVAGGFLDCALLAIALAAVVCGVIVGIEQARRRRW